MLAAPQGPIDSNPAARWLSVQTEPSPMREVPLSLSPPYSNPVDSFTLVLPPALMAPPRTEEASLPVSFLERVFIFFELGFLAAMGGSSSRVQDESV